MSVSKISKGLLLGLALLLATSGFAANKGSLQVDDPVTVNGKPLAAGEYTVKWDGAGPNVEVNIMKGKNVVATVPARMLAERRATFLRGRVQRKQGPLCRNHPRPSQGRTKRAD